MPNTLFVDVHRPSRNEAPPGYTLDVGIAGVRQSIGVEKMVAKAMYKETMGRWGGF
jgi:hypothetical protein